MKNRIILPHPLAEQASVVVKEDSFHTSLNDLNIMNAYWKEKGIGRICSLDYFIKIYAPYQVGQQLWVAEGWKILHSLPSAYRVFYKDGSYKFLTLVVLEISIKG